MCACPAEQADAVVVALRGFNPAAAVIGEVLEGKGVTLLTGFGKRLLTMPSGVLVPRIC